MNFEPLLLFPVTQDWLQNNPLQVQLFGKMTAGEVIVANWP